MITILKKGGGSLGTPKSDYVICARPLNYSLTTLMMAMTTMHDCDYEYDNGNDYLITMTVKTSQVLTDPHSPAQFRVNGPLANLKEFSEVSVHLVIHIKRGQQH